MSVRRRAIADRLERFSSFKEYKELYAKLLEGKSRMGRYLRRRARRRQVAEAKKLKSFESALMRQLFGAGGEPSWDDIRQGARAKLLEPFAGDARDEARVRKIWEKPGGASG